MSATDIQSSGGERFIIVGGSIWSEIVLCGNRNDTPLSIETIISGWGNAKYGVIFRQCGDSYVKVSAEEIGHSSLTEEQYNRLVASKNLIAKNLAVYKRVA